MPLAEWCTPVYFETMHTRQLFSLDLGHGERARVDLQHVDGGEAEIYREADGAATAAQARQYAAALLDAADELERVTR